MRLKSGTLRSRLELREPSGEIDGPYLRVNQRRERAVTDTRSAEGHSLDHGARGEVEGEV